jgi:hypothetical protein
MKKLPDFHVNPLEDEESLSLVFWFLLFVLFLTLALLGVAGIFWILIVLPILALLNDVSDIRRRFFTRWGRIHYPLIHRFDRFMDLDLFDLGVLRDALKDGSDFDYFYHCEIELRLMLKSIFPKLHGTELKSYLSTALKKGESTLRDQQSIVEIFSRKDKIYMEKATQDELFTNARNILSAARKYDDSWFERQLKPRLIIADLVERKYGRDEMLEYLHAVLTEKIAWFNR